MTSDIKAIIMDILECDSFESMLSEEISSLKMLQIIMALDENGIYIPIDKIPALNSIGSLFDMLGIQA